MRRSAVSLSICLLWTLVSTAHASPLCALDADPAAPTLIYDASTDSGTDDGEDGGKPAPAPEPEPDCD